MGPDAGQMDPKGLLHNDTNYASGFVSELIRTGNETAQLRRSECARLLRGAQLTLFATTATRPVPPMPWLSTTPDDIVQCLEHMAAHVRDFAVHEIAEALLKAGESVKVGRILVDARSEWKHAAL